MTAEEFNQWLMSHSASFPNWGRSVDLLPNRLLTLANWRRALSSVSFESAMKASDEMMQGTHFQKVPFEVGEHVSRVVARAKELDALIVRRPVQFADEPRSSCSVCRDEGVILVVDPRSEPIALCRAGVWCGCPIGQRMRDAEASYRERRSPHVPASESPIYDPDRHVRWRPDEEAMRVEFENLKPANFEPAFDNWNTEV